MSSIVFLIPKKYMSLETVIEVDHSKGSVDTSECEKALFFGIL